MGLSQFFQVNSMSGGQFSRKASRKGSNPYVLPQGTLQTSPPGYLMSLQMFNRTYKLHSYRCVFERESYQAGSSASVALPPPCL